MVGAGDGSVLMTLLNRSMLRDVRRMDFRRQDSCGGIRSTIGNIIKKQVRLWIRRIEHCFRLYDVVRIDHFRGFDEYYAVPYGEKTAVHGKWMPGPGIELFRTLEEKIGRKRIIAEDLGFLTPSVIQLLKESGFPGMKVLQFAFDSREDSNYLPHTYTRNCVVYTGTHDNDTTKDGITRRQDQHGSLQKNTCISPVLMKIRLREILLLWQWEARRICASFR